MIKTFTIKNRAVSGARLFAININSTAAVATLIDAYASVGRPIPADLAEEALRMAEKALAAEEKAEILALVAEGYQFRAAQ